MAWTKEEVASFLGERCPNIKLIEWGGSAGEISKFENLSLGFIFSRKFKVLKSNILHGNSNIENLGQKALTVDNVNRFFKKNNLEKDFQCLEVLNKGQLKIFHKPTETILRPTFYKLKKGILEGRSFGFGKLNEKQVEFWLRENMPHIKLLKFSGSGSSASDFFDLDKNVKFSIAFNTLKGIKARDPNYAPNRSRKESAKLAKATIIKKRGKDAFKLIAKKSLSTKIKNGQIPVIKGKTIPELAKEKNIPYSTLVEKYRNFGEISVENAARKFTNLEILIGSFFELEDIEYKKEFQIKSKFDSAKLVSDFFIEEKNLIIECDGLYWHSECKKNKEYHKEKLQAYEENGYRALFFRGDEIKYKLPIVKSIILNQLNRSKRLYARKLEHGTCSRGFFEQNHLMGKGQGRIYSLNLHGEPMAAMQVKWKNKKEKTLEISRFCTKLNHSVIGGWSKILKRVIEVENPNKIITFVDRRYGSGEYLKSMGWKKASENLSFKWVGPNSKKTYHRMKFPGNSGYEKGLIKIWDCGQAKWEKEISKNDQSTP